MYGSFYVAEVEQCDWSEVRSSYGDKSVKISPGFLGVLVGNKFNKNVVDIMPCHLKRLGRRFLSFSCRIDL